MYHSSVLFPLARKIYKVGFSFGSCSTAQLELSLTQLRLFYVPWLCIISLGQENIQGTVNVEHFSLSFHKLNTGYQDLNS